MMRFDLVDLGLFRHVVEAGSITHGAARANLALAAASALTEYEPDAETIARKAMKIASDVCVYTNENVTVETMESAS